MKYELTDKTMELFGRKLHRIRAVMDFRLSNGRTVKSGDLGGWIEQESNLSQDGNAWVFDSALVYGSAQVYDSAQVYGSAQVCDSARVYDSAQVYGSAQVFDSALVYGSAQVYDSALVYGSAQVCDLACVYGFARVYGSARVCDSARVYDSAQVYGSAQVFDSALVYGSAQVYDSAWVYGSAWVCDSARVANNNHWLSIGPIGSRDGTTTFTRDKAGTIHVKCRCFCGTIDEFREKVKETHAGNAHEKAYLAAADLAEKRINTTPI